MAIKAHKAKAAEPRPGSTGGRRPKPTSADPLMKPETAPGWARQVAFGMGPQLASAGGAAGADDAPGPFGVLVGDSAFPGPGQVTRVAFMERLETWVRAAADEELAPVGRTAKDCPYLEAWLAFYRTKPAGHIERAIRHYASGDQPSPEGLAAAVEARVRVAVRRWRETGGLSGIPSQTPLLPPATAAGDAPRPHANAAAATASPLLGAGRPQRLDSHAAARLRSVLGERFDDVTVHTGPEAAALTARHGALALSAGRSIAFAAGAYRPGTISGDALLAHELAHAAEQRNAVGPAPTTVSRDAPAEAAADGAAVGVVSRALGWAANLPGRTAAGIGGLRLRACTAGSPLTTSQRAAADAAATRAFGDVPELLSVYRSVYGGQGLRVGSVSPGREAETSSGTTVLPTSSLSFGAPRLGALLIHELSHHRDPTGSGLGLADAFEGFAYAVEIMILQRLLERAGTAMTPTERSEVEARIRVIGGLYARPPTIWSLATAYRENFDDLLGALQILFRVVDGQPMTWGASGPPPGIPGMTPAVARTIIRDLLTTSSGALRDISTTAGALVQWVHEHGGEVSWIGLSAALGTLTPAAPGPSPSAPPPTPPSRSAAPPTRR